MLTVERLVVHLDGHTKDFVRSMEQVYVSVNTLSNMATRAGRNISLGLTAPILALGAASTKAFATFDKNMTQATAIMGELSDQTKQTMKDLAFELSDKGIQSSADLAKSYFYLTSAGFKAQETIAMLPTVSKFATAGMFEMEKATTLLADAQSALGLKTGSTALQLHHMERLASELTHANNIANATVEQFSESLTTKAGAALKVFNKESSEGIAVLAAYADQGIKAELAGNALDRVTRLLSQSANENAEAHAMLGFQVFDNTGKMRNYADIIGNLEDITRGMSDQQKVLTLDMLGFEARVQQVILPLMGTSKAIRRYEEELKNAGGTLDEVSNKQLKSFSAQLTMAKNQLTNAGIVIGQHLAPVLLTLMNSLAEVANMFRELSPLGQQAEILILALVAAVGPLILALGTLGQVAAFTSAGLRTLAIMLGMVRLAAIASTVALVALKALLAGTAIVLALMAAKALLDAVTGMNQFNEALEENVKIQEKLQALTDKRNAATIEAANNIKDEAERVAFLTQQYEAAQRQVESYRAMLQKDLGNQSKVVAENNLNEVGLVEYHLVGRKNLIVEAKQQVEETTKKLETALAFADQLRDAMEKVRATEQAAVDLQSAELVADASEYIKALEEEAATHGMTADQIKRREFALRELNPQQLAEIDNLIQLKEVREAETQAAKDAEKAQEQLTQAGQDLVSQLAKELAMMKVLEEQSDMGAASQQVMEAAMSGITDEYLKQASAIADVIDAMTKQQDLMKRGKDLTDSVKSDQERFNDKINEYRELLDNNAISQEVFNAAVKKLQEQFSKDLNVKVGIQGLEALEAGSLAAALAVQKIQSQRLVEQLPQKSAVVVQDRPAGEKDNSVDGRTAVDYLKIIAEALSDPNSLILKLAELENT